MVRVAVVGVNRIGTFHCNAYQTHPDAELVAVCDLDAQRAQQAASQFGVRAYTDLSRLLDAEDVDVVSVATSGVEGGSQHYLPASIAIEAGIDVLVEKPLSNSIDESRELVSAARSRSVRLACDLNHRFVPTAEKGRELIQTGLLGDILFVNMRLTIRNLNETTPWVHMRALHSHSIDVVRYFAGDVKRVQAFMTKAPGRNIWSTASVNLEFQSGAVGHLTGSYDMSMRHPIEMCEVAGNRGRFVIDNVYQNFTFYPHDSDELLAMNNALFGGLGSFHDTLRRRIHAFVDDVRDQVDPDMVRGSGAEALAAQEVVEAAIRSQIAGGSTVDVKTLS